MSLFSDASSRFGDIERIEVLKGPQGVLYGGNNIGGAVKYVSKTPSPEELGGRLKVMAGEQGIWDIEGDINIPLSNKWALRAFAFTREDDAMNNPGHYLFQSTQSARRCEPRAIGWRIVLW